MAAGMDANALEGEVHMDPEAGGRRKRSINVGYKSPVLAGFLSLLPGLGQVYSGYYQRGIVHAIVFATLIWMLSGNGGADQFFGPLMGFFYLYNIIDATRRAAFVNRVLDGVEEVDLPDDRLISMTSGGSILGGLALAVFGLLVFLDLRFGVSMEWLEEWWPIGLIALGLYIFARGVQRRTRAS